MTPRPLLPAVLLACALPALAAPPAQVGYVQAGDSSQRERERGREPAHASPVHLLDGREATAWCTPGADPLGVLVRLGLTDSVRLDGVRIATGNGRDEASFQGFSRARTFLLRSLGPGATRRFSVEDRRGLQTVALEPPLEGSDFTLEVVDHFPADDPERPVCISEVVLSAQGQPLGSEGAARRVPRGALAQLVGSWFGGEPGAPDRSLAFFADGTYRFVHRPFDAPQAPTHLAGRFQLRGERLTLELPGGQRVSGRWERTAEPGGSGAALVLESELPEPMRGRLRERP